MSVMSGQPATLKRLAHTAPHGWTSARLSWLAGGTLAYTAAGWLDLFAGVAGNVLTALGTFALLLGGTLLLLRAVLSPHNAPSLPDRPAQRLIRRALFATLALFTLITIAVAANLITSAGDTGIYDSDA